MSVEIKEGAVLKDGEVIARYSPDTKTVTSASPIFPAHKAQINSAIGEKVAFVVDDGSEEAKPAATSVIDPNASAREVATRAEEEMAAKAPKNPEPPKQKSLLEIARETEEREEAEEKARLAREETERIEREKAIAEAPVEERRKFDPEPQMDLMAGDKTPAYIEWFKRNHSDDEYRAKYSHRNFANKD